MNISSALLPPNRTPPSTTTTTHKPYSTLPSSRLSYSHSSPNPTPTTTTTSRSPLPKTLRQDLTPRNEARLTYYANLASDLAEDGKFEDFFMIAESVLVAGTDPSLFVASLNVKLVSAGIAGLIRDGRIGFVADVFSRVQKLGFSPLTLFDRSVTKLLAGGCRRLLKDRKLKEVVDLMETLAGFHFPVKEFIKPHEIIDLCVEKRDPHVAVRYARILPHAHILFSSIIQGFGKKGDLVSALIAFETSKCNSDSPNMYACRTVIDVCGLCGDFLKSRYIYEELLAQKVTPNVFVFNSLMNVNAHDMSYTLHVYKHMQNLGVAADMASYNILLKACCFAGRVDLAHDIYEEVRHRASTGTLKLDVITYSTIIKVFADAKMWQMALKIKEDMLSAGVTPNVVTWSSLISACSNAGLVEQATQLFEEMLLAGCIPNSHVCNSLLYACVEACQYDRTFRIFQSWRESGSHGIVHTTKYNRINEDHICINVEHSSRNGFTKLQSISSDTYRINSADTVPFQPTTATYNILMKACGTDYYRAKGLMDEMEMEGLSPSLISWSILIDISGRSGNVGASIQALKMMRDAGIKPDVIAYTTAIKACVKNKRLKIAFSLFEEMKSYRIQPNLVTYNTLLRARTRYGSLHEVQQCLAIYQDMRKAGYNPNDYYLKELIEEWCEGVIQDNNQSQGTMGLCDSRSKTDGQKTQSLLLEKVAAHLQRDNAQSVAIDLRGITKVEARIIVLAVLRMIKENYSIGHSIDDDIVIILEIRKEGTGAANNNSEVQDAVVRLLRDELGLSVVFTGSESSPAKIDSRNPLDRDLNQENSKNNGLGIKFESSTRRPVILRRLKVTRKSLYHWLRKRVGIIRR